MSNQSQARITLARAVYSRAGILLLDDVLSALDVHTAKWIVEKCFQGELIRGRTVILVTHNVVLAAPIASFAIELNSDGKVIRQGSDMLGERELLEADVAAKVNSEGTHEDDTKPDNSAGDSSKGKLILAEEIALGRVSWKAIKLYTDHFGGAFFWLCSLGGYVLAFGLSASAVWFLGYWASQYETHPSSSVPVVRYLGLYIAISCGAYLFEGMSAMWFMFGAIKAARAIHGRLINSIFSAPLR